MLYGEYIFSSCTDTSNNRGQEKTRIEKPPTRFSDEWLLVAFFSDTESTDLSYPDDQCWPLPPRFKTVQSPPLLKPPEPEKQSSTCRQNPRQSTDNQSGQTHAWAIPAEVLQRVWQAWYATLFSVHAQMLRRSGPGTCTGQACGFDLGGFREAVSPLKSTVHIGCRVRQGWFETRP